MYESPRVTVEEIDTLGIFLIFCPNLLHTNQIFLIFAASISFIKNENKEKRKKYL